MLTGTMANWICATGGGQESWGRPVPLLRPGRFAAEPHGLPGSGGAVSAHPSPSEGTADRLPEAGEAGLLEAGGSRSLLAESKVGMALFAKCL